VGIRQRQTFSWGRSQPLGVAPSVEVKRPDLADAGSPDDAGGPEEDSTNKTPQPNEKHDAAPETKQEDLQLKRALGALRDNKPAAAQKTA